MAVYKRRQIWYYRFQIRGVRYARAVPEARTKWQAQRAELKAKEDAFEGRYGKEPSSIKLKDFVEQVYLPWARAEKKSWRNDESRVKPILAFFRNRQMREITNFNVRQFKKERLLSTISPRSPKRKDAELKVRAPASVDRELQLLARIFSLAIGQGELLQNPCKGVALCATDNVITQYLTAEEEARLLPVLSGRRSRLLDILVIDLHTGMRKSELLSLHKSQVDFLRGRILLTRTKNGKSRTVPIHDDIRPILQRLCDTSGASGYLFENRRTGKPIQDIKTAWRSALKDAGICHMPFHCAGRHTFGTRAAANGAHLTDVQEIMDHADIKTTMRYVHATEAGKRRAVEAAVKGRSGTNMVQAKRATG